MRRLLTLIALLLPLTAAAEDEVPVDASSVDEPAPIDAPPEVVEAPVAPPTANTTTTTVTSPDGTTTTTTTTAPSATAPITPASPALVVDEDPCGVHKYAHWRNRMKGRISIGFSKSHLELEDDAEGTQKSFVARLNGRRGWSIELELSKLTLDGGDTARSAGASVVKAFGRRKIAPYLLAGAGGGRYESADGTEQRMHFGEVGGGVMLRGKRFSIGVDMRRGVRKLEEEEIDVKDVMRVATPGEEADDRDRYTRGRVLALINF